MNLFSLSHPRLSRRLTLGVAALALSAGLLPTAHAQETTVKFQLDWRFEGPAALFLVPVSQGLLQGREAQRHRRRRQRLGRHRHARGLGHLRHGLRRPGRADGVPRQQPHRAQQAGRGDDGLQQHARRGAGAQEERHQDAGRPERQEAGRAGVRRRPQGLADLRQGQRRGQRGLDGDGPAAARDHAGARRHRRHHRLLVHLAAQPRGARHQDRRRGRDALPATTA